MKPIAKKFGASFIGTFAMLLIMAMSYDVHSDFLKTYEVTHFVCVAFICIWATVCLITLIGFFANLAESI